ncbi:hypothetical protein C8Q76DRAFT_630242 [Earliella scabrosa]|nr:hypothetical protein C8Q76DRAFT_630242 [Earliella scabrosa]
MDLRSLLQWRATCRAHYALALEDLKGYLHTTLETFVPNGADFLETLTESRGVIGGLCALSFFLRDLSFPIHYLEVFVTDLTFHIMMDYFTYSSVFAADRLTLEALILPPHAISRRRGIARYAVFRTTDRKIIIINESTTMSPCTPIARTWTSALMNFVTAHTFGCAYPRMTLRRHAMFSDLFMATMSNREQILMACLAHQDFSFGTDPSHWPEYSAGEGKELAPGITPCFRDQFLCPDQGRYFGDHGSFIGFIDPRSSDSISVWQRRIAPYGNMVGWRLWSACVCDRGCSVHDSLLHPGVRTIPVFFVDDPFFSVYNTVPTSTNVTPAKPAVQLLPMRIKNPGRPRAVTI